MKNKISKLLEIISLMFIVIFANWTNAQTVTHQKKPNVLFFIIDDLRTELGCYGNENIISPNIDRLANSGYRFDNAFCQVPVCGASRSSFLTGQMPNRHKFVDYDAWVEKDAPNAVTLPMCFKENGYVTISNGKVFHHLIDSKNSWTEQPWAPNVPWRDYLSKENKQIAAANKKRIHKPVAKSFESVDVDDYAYIDGKVAKKTINDLKKLKENGKPFFLAVGFRKPHLPYNHPKKYWEMYEGKNIPPADNPFPPKDVPKASIHNSFELRVYTDIPDTGKIPLEKAKQLKRAYYACITYVDKLVGEVIDSLKSLGLYDNTIIVLIGDHGYQLGEHTMWTKHSNYELSLRAPLLLHVPGMKKNVGVESLAEFADIYPTLCDLTGLKIPNTVEGKSLLPLLNGKKSEINNAVFSRFKDGESVRTERYLYTEYRDENSNLYAKMLYDHKTDPEENVNVVNKPEYEKVVSKLAKLLEEYRKKYSH